MNEQPIVQVDAFTNERFRGNPAAVCVLGAAREDVWLQAVAREMNLSETAFVLRRSEGFDLRWFTPTTEVPICGHATLASAHLLWEEGQLARSQPAQFHTLSGMLVAWRERDWICLDFPVQMIERPSVPPELLSALGVGAKNCVSTALFNLVEVESEEVVRLLSPALRRLMRIGSLGVMVTSRASAAGYDFVSRFFAPAIGIDEDPVTGVAHCCLGPYWAERLGKSEVVGYQASPRGGVVRVRVAGNGVAAGRVHILGQAVTVMRGVLA